MSMSSATDSGSAARPALPPGPAPRTVPDAPLGPQDESDAPSVGRLPRDPPPLPACPDEPSGPRGADDGSPLRCLGGFALLGKLGHGPMGTVFKARQLELQRSVALKVLAPRLLGDPAFVERFQAAARAAGRRPHPNIAALIDVGHADGAHYLATTLVRGGTLASVLARDGHLAEERALALARDVARALEHAHDNGLLHLDLRPTNVLLSAEGAARVTDVALAAATAGHAASEGSRFVSPPGYRAPEVERGDTPVDGRADIFSLGVLLFEMLAGENPFLAPNPIDTAATVLTRSLPDVSAATRRLLAKMTTHDPAGRYGSAAEVVAALDAALASTGLGADSGASARRSRRRKKQITLSVAAGGALAALVALVAVLARPGRATRPAKAAAPAATPAQAVRQPADPPRDAPRPAVTQAARQRLERFRAALARADEFARRHPSAHLSQVERYERVLADFPHGLPPEGRDLRRTANGRLERLRRHTDALANRALEEAIDRAEDLFAKHQQAEAVRLLETFDPELKTAPVAAEVQRRHDALLARARRSFEAVQATARQLVAKGQLEEAREAYRQARASTLPELAARADKALAALDAQIAQRNLERRRQEARAYPKLARTIRGHLERRRYPQALELIDGALADAWNPAIRANLRAHRDLALAARGFWAKAVAGVRALAPGQLVRVGGSAGAFVSLEGHLVRYRVGRVVAGLPLERLKPQEAIDYAAEGLQKAGKPLDGPFFAQCALFLAAEAQPSPARRALARAQRQGADVTRAARLLDRFAPQD